ncbi:NAD(P)/FAD-dependent oxidoreductase [Candidatus Micrarchaeota archaeon]|nr:NAD(P)/FAD-dependent oxidoreductase [Candidatus Micrarchaeota archaeon]
MKKVLIIGAGPAGLFAAYELCTNSNLEITIFDKGKRVKNRKCPKKQTNYCTNCNPCNILCGIGGAGTFSDGKINFHYEVGGDLLRFKSLEETEQLLDKIRKIFIHFGAKPEDYFEPDGNADILSREAKKNGVRFLPLKQLHIGSDKLPDVIENMTNFLQSKGVIFKTEEEVKDIVVELNKIKGVKTTEEIIGDYVIISPGRSGTDWLKDIAKKQKLKIEFQSVDVGVRVEVPDEVMDEITKINYDPKFYIMTQRDDLVRTFCTNPHGFVSLENYGKFVCVNGHAMKDKKSKNTNFAFLVRISLTEPVEDTISYGEKIAELATQIGGGKPIVQRLKDLKRGRRSNWERINKSYVKPTLGDVTPGDISMALPSRVVEDIKEGLEKLSSVIPGVDSDSTLLYAPEIKFYSLKLSVDKNMETEVKDLFVCGDGAGVSRGINGAAFTGLIAAQEINKREKEIKGKQEKL